MSSKPQLDLLVRVRYTNPLPPPPYPPKLLNIETDPKRYAKADFTQALSNETPLPMIADSELGMPLDLSNFDSLWNGSTDDSSLNPKQLAPPIVDDRDLFMLDLPGSSTAAPSNNVNVSWLRKTEYISRDTQRLGTGPTIDVKSELDETIDTSIPAQVRSIEATFPSIDKPLDLSTIKHPNKPGVEALEVYDFLPDSDLWANSYDVFRFAERPGDRPPELADVRLDCAILRPQENEDGEHFLSFYLTKEDHEAEDYRTGRLADEFEQEDKPPTAFYMTRDYETSKVEPDVSNEFLLVLDDAEDFTKKTSHTTKGAYYTGIQRKIALRKKRATKNEALPKDRWDIIQISHAPFTAEEDAERQDALGVVNDPSWLARAKEIQEAKEHVAAEIFGNGSDAEGEAEDELPRRTNGVHLNGDTGEEE